MKKKKVYKVWLKLLIVVLIIFVAILLPYQIWDIKSPSYINILIIDKTVPNDSYREHKSLMWILNNQKIFNKSTSKPFKYNEDYYGFIPRDKDTFDVRQLPVEINEDIDLIYLADTYGVYREDLMGQNVRGNRSEIIYGGMWDKETDKIISVLKNNTIIGEFNILASPTEESVRTKMENVFGFEWTGWIGRYFTNLSLDNPEVPYWLINDYENQYNREWNFDGPGFAFVKSDDTVVILNEEMQFGKKLNQIKISEELKTEFKVKNNVKYYYWFEITKEYFDTEVLARYHLDLTEEGEKILLKYGINNDFPAIMRNKKDYTSYYFAGDFVDNEQIPSRWDAKGICFLNKISTIDIKGNQNYFFYNVYYPMIEKILSDIVEGK